MSNRALRRLCAALALFTSACTKGSSPAQPSQTSAPSDTSVTSSVTVPRPLLPPTELTIPNAQQPVTLVVGNAVITGSGGAIYTFEVASDAAFSSKVYTKSGVPEGSGGQTSLTIDNRGAGADYYWHARAEGGGTIGPFSAARKFTIGPEIVINPPIPLAPMNGATTSGWPTFTVTNAIRTGVVVPLVYRFEIATSLTFSTLALVQTVPETLNQTSYTPPSGQPAPVQTNLFWRATAIDTSDNVSSPPSAAQSFTYADPTRQTRIAAQLGVPLWPGVQPMGSTGHATLGLNWDVQTIRSFDGVTFVSPPLDQLQVFDLLDRGFDPDGAINWMKNNGYSTAAVWYPFPAVIGFRFEYMALINGQWDVVIRVGG